MTHNFERLRDHILPLSQSKIFEAARIEWVLEFVEVSAEWDSCPCGQEIKEHSYIRNTVTGHQTYVGTQFAYIDSNRRYGICASGATDLLRSYN